MDAHELHWAWNRVIAFYCINEDLTLDKQLCTVPDERCFGFATLQNETDPLNTPKE